MKYTILILLSGMIICGCSKKPAIDTVETGKDIKWRDGLVLHVQKRDGTLLEGITISGMKVGDQNQTMMADTGTIKPGVITNGTSDDSVIIILHTPTVRVIIDSSNFMEAPSPYRDYPIELKR
jgi:hypothetical protein